MCARSSGNRAPNRLPMEQAAFAKLIQDDVNKWGELIRAAGIQPE